MQAIARVNSVFEGKPNGLVVDFISISGFWRKPPKNIKGVGGEGKPALDLEMAVKLWLSQFEKMKEMIGGFDLEGFEAMTTGEKVKWLNRVVNDLLDSDAVTDHFLHEDRKLSELMAMTNSDKRIWKIQYSVAVILKIKL